jgi:uncharacterized protein YndB with AHSA1/START domain
MPTLHLKRELPKGAVFMVAGSVDPQDAIVTELEIAAPPQRVFAALTDPRQLNRWWTSPICDRTTWTMDPRPGGEWSFATTPGSQSINGVNEFKCRGKILEMDPPRLLVYSWIANWNDDPAVITTVKWELTPAAGGTRVKVTHSGLAQMAVAREAYRGGWPGVITNLKNFVENQ